MKKLAIITTHPIQYHAPLFKILAERGIIKIMVFYTWGKEVMKNKYDPGFGKTINWDIDLLQGYPFTWVNNTSVQPGSHHYKGIINPNLLKDLEIWKPDAILIFGWNFKSHLKIIRYFHNKIPIFFRGDSTLLDRGYGLKEMFKKIILKWIYKHVDKGLYVGEENKKYFKYAGLKEEQLLFAPHAVDNARFAFDENIRGRIRTKLTISQHDIVFLFAGKLESKKNPGLLLNAFCKLDNINAHLIIAGDGELEMDLKNKFEHKLNIHFLPFHNQSEMPGLYSACDVFILPSQGPGETWGLSVNEAMACERPVLVSNKCGCAIDLVQNNKNGFIFQSGNQEELIQKMEYFINNKNELKSMGKYSSKIIKNYDYQNICEVLEKLMNK